MNNSAITLATLKAKRDELASQLAQFNAIIAAFGGNTPHRRRTRKPSPAKASPVTAAKTVDRGAAARKAWATKKAKANSGATAKAASLADAAA